MLIAEESRSQSHRQTPQEIITRGLSTNDTRNAYLYASAEVFVREVAHIAYAAMMQQPTALVDKKGEAVGFYLELDEGQQITSAQHVAKADLAFFADPTRPTDLVAIAAFKQSNDLSPQVAEVIDALRKINVLVYQERPDDLLNQVLLDQRGRLATFARLGYLL